MRRTTAVALAATLSCLLPALASGAKKVPAQLGLARYVCLGYDTGQGFMSEQQSLSAPYDVYPEDRHALDAVRDAIEKWGKYVITVQPGDADLLIGVRWGRRAGTSVGIGGGAGTGRPGGFGSLGSAGVELSTSDDLFTVYDRSGTQLWRQQGRGIFAGSPPRAFEEFRRDVESIPPPKQPVAPEKKPPETKPER